MAFNYEISNLNYFSTIDSNSQDLFPGLCRVSISHGSGSVLLYATTAAAATTTTKI